MKQLTTIEQIKAAVDSGADVRCNGGGYRVTKDGLGQYLIKFIDSDYTIGLHGAKGTKYANQLNARDFYINSTELTPCRFYFTGGQSFAGFADGSTWNGFDNVYVTADTHDQICAHFRNEYKSSGEDAEGVAYLMQSFDELEPDDDGLYSYAYGFATSIDTDYIYGDIERFSLKGETLAAISDAVWQAIGEQLTKEFPSAKYGDLSPLTTAALDTALRAVVIQWIDYNVPTDARCDYCYTSASPDDRDTTCRNCGRGVIR